MSDRYFLDTNIFVYTFDASDKRKRRIAMEIITQAGRDGLATISFQVIQEFCSVAIHKFPHSPSHDELREYIEKVLAPLCTVHSGIELYQSAIEIQRRWEYSFYDSLIISAAVIGRCRTLYTEDLSDGYVIKGVKIVNPF